MSSILCSCHLISLVRYFFVEFPLSSIFFPFSSFLSFSSAVFVSFLISRCCWKQVYFPDCGQCEGPRALGSLSLLRHDPIRRNCIGTSEENKEGESDKATGRGGNDDGGSGGRGGRDGERERGEVGVGGERERESGQETR